MQDWFSSMKEWFVLVYFSWGIVCFETGKEIAK